MAVVALSDCWSPSRLAASSATVAMTIPNPGDAWSVTVVAVAGGVGGRVDRCSRRLTGGVLVVVTVANTETVSLNRVGPASLAYTVGRNFVHIRTARQSKYRYGFLFDKTAIHVVTSDSISRPVRKYRPPVEATAGSLH
jgi:hypothetical protein